MPEPEVFRPVCGWEGLYEVSDRGRVRRSARGRSTYPGRVLKPFIVQGAPVVVLVRGRRLQRRRVHRLVAEAFLTPCLPRPGAWRVVHRNGDPTDNRAANLAWAHGGAA